jgi:hypothetical protein
LPITHGGIRAAMARFLVHNASQLLLDRTASTATTGHRLLLASARTTVGLGTLTANGQTPPMPQSSVRVNLHQSLDIQLRLPPKITFNRQIVDQFAKTLYFAFAQIADARAVVDSRRIQKTPAGSITNSIDISQSNDNPFVTRKIYTFNTSHVSHSFRL